MPAISSVSAIVGVAKQGSRGTIAANPTFAHGLKGGSPIKVDPSQSVLEVTTGKRAGSNVVREEVKNSSDIQAPGYLKSLGLYLLGALGSVVTTGAGPYVHTFATGDLPYLTIFEKGIGSTIQAIRDSKIEEVSIKWDGAKPVELSVKAQGTVFSYPSTFTPTVDETGSESFLVPVGGTFQLDVLGGSVTSARVQSGEITIKNNVATIADSTTIEAGDVADGNQEISLKLTIVPDDLVLFRSTVTGATGGTTVASDVPVGSVNLLFTENGPGTGQLAVTGSKVAFLTSFPDVDPKGGPVQLELAGMAVVASGATSPLIFALTNAQTAY
ncbi:MAG: hypothetical protein KGL39_23030 [Patescibacteria group bacterium]|nr:hypothetical protein [Patescibacteria group bacterium]